MEKFLFPKTFDPIEPAKECYVGDIQPVDSLGNVSPVLASSLTPRVPRYLVEVDDSSRRKKFSPSQTPDFENRDNQIRMVGLGFMKSTSELQNLRIDLDSQAPELVLEGQLSPKADIWSLGYLVCHQILCRQIG